MTTDELKDIIREDLKTIASGVERGLRQSSRMITSGPRQAGASDAGGLREALRAIADGLENLAKKLK